MAFVRTIQENFQWTGFADNVDSQGKIKIMNGWGTDDPNFAAFKNYNAINGALAPIRTCETSTGGKGRYSTWGQNDSGTWVENMCIMGEVTMDGSTGKFSWAEIDGVQTDGFMRFDQPAQYCGVNANLSVGANAGTINHNALTLQMQCKRLRAFEPVPIIGMFLSTGKVGPFTYSSGYARENRHSAHRSTTDQNGITYYDNYHGLGGQHLGAKSPVIPPYLVKGGEGGLWDNGSSIGHWLLKQSSHGDLIGEYNSTFGGGAANAMARVSNTRYSWKWLYWVHDGQGNAMLFTGLGPGAVPSNTTTEKWWDVNELWGKNGHYRWKTPYWFLEKYALYGTDVLKELNARYRENNTSDLGYGQSDLRTQLGTYRLDNNQGGSVNSWSHGDYIHFKKNTNCQILWYGQSSNADLSSPAILYLDNKWTFDNQKQKLWDTCLNTSSYHANVDPVCELFSGRFQEAVFQNIPAGCQFVGNRYTYHYLNDPVMNWFIMPTVQAQTEFHYVNTGSNPRRIAETGVAGQPGTHAASFLWPRNGYEIQFPDAGASYDPVINARANPATTIVDAAGDPMGDDAEDPWLQVTSMFDSNQSTYTVVKKYGEDNAVFIGLNAAQGVSIQDTDQLSTFTITVNNLALTVLGNYALMASICDNAKDPLVTTSATQRIVPPVYNRDTPTGGASYVITFTISDLAGVRYSDVKDGFIKLWAISLD